MSLAQRDHPKLKGPPVAVGGDPKGRGVVMTSSGELGKPREYLCLGDLTGSTPEPVLTRVADRVGERTLTRREPGAYRQWRYVHL